ncbi:hypothetical protein [Microbacterium sp.]|uniref:hypothetical protein n=1 Tax=Microbacterium sp. TaxID=51671 RepID=UPI003A907E72
MRSPLFFRERADRTTTEFYCRMPPPAKFRIGPCCPLSPGGVAADLEIATAHLDELVAGVTTWCSMRTTR